MSMLADYLVSVVVPTHNRSIYAISCVKSLLAIESDRLQVIVHDTSTDDCRLRTWVATVNDSRLLYRHCAERLSMTDNHERALEYARGEYVCLIGDDDSVSSLILDVADYARSRAVDCITPQVKAAYSWPDFRTSLLGAAHAGRLYLEAFTGESRWVDSAQALEGLLLHAGQGTDGLPKLYHGLVRRELIQRVVLANGRLFWGTSPDMSAAVALALATEKFLLLDIPFTLPGASGGSNTGRSALKSHKGDLRSDEHMRPFKNLRWPEQIPQFFSVETVWAHAAWETLVACGRQDLLQRFNWPRLYALALFNHKDYRQAIMQATRANSGVGVMKSIASLPLISWEWFWNRLKRLARPSASNGREVLGVFPGVDEARCCLDARVAVVARVHLNGE